MSFVPSQTPTAPSKIPPNEVGKATGVHLAPLLAEMCSRLWPDRRYWGMDRTDAIVLGEVIKTLGYDARMQCCTISNTNAIARPLNLYGIHLEEGLIFANGLLHESWGAAVLSLSLHPTWKETSIQEVPLTPELILLMPKDEMNWVLQMLPIARDLAFDISGIHLDRNTAKTLANKKRNQL